MIDPKNPNIGRCPICGSKIDLTPFLGKNKHVVLDVDVLLPIIEFTILVEVKDFVTDQLKEDLKISDEDITEYMFMNALLDWLGIDESDRDEFIENEKEGGLFRIGDVWISFDPSKIYLLK